MREAGPRGVMRERVETAAARARDGGKSAATPSQLKQRETHDMKIPAPGSLLQPPACIE